jgi:hypothetical protein
MPYGTVPGLCLIASGNGTPRENQRDGVLELCLKCAGTIGSAFAATTHGHVAADERPLNEALFRV